jgi:hypothetical protein
MQIGMTLEQLLRLTPSEIDARFGDKCAGCGAPLGHPDDMIRIHSSTIQTEDTMLLEKMRDPLPHETESYLSAIRSRNKEFFIEFQRLHPQVFWGTVATTLSQEDAAWADQVIQAEQVRNTDDGDC